MNANLIVHTDPFRPHFNSEPVKIRPLQTIFELLFSLDLCVQSEDGIRRTSVFVVLVNSDPVLQKDWNRVICETDVVQIVHIPRGGGGSNISSIIAAVAIAVLAYFTFGLSLVASAAVGVAAYAGMTVLSGMIPKPSSSLGASSREATSPTYSLNAQGNNARLLEAVPRIYGRVRMYPDLASQPYTEYQGNVQYLYQLFCVSLGRVEIEKILIDETDIDQFEDATYEIVQPGSAVTLFPDNVVTSDAVSGIELLGPNNPSYTIVGPYVAAPAGTVTNYIGIDVGFPRGAGTTDDSGNSQPRSVSFTFEYQLIDDNGAAIGAWTTLIAEAVVFATTQAQTLSYKVEVPNGRYQVRAYRASNEPGDNRSWDDVQWLSLRAYLPSTLVYDNVTVLAVQMRATSILNSTTARKFSVIATGMVSKWNPVDGWGPLVATQSPAWAAADILRNSVYGRNLVTSRFNVQELYRLAAVWEARGDNFNFVFDSTVQLWDALSKALRVGRATPIYYAGLIDFIRDEPQAIPQSMFQPSNIIAGSFKTTYQFFGVDSPDCVEIEFVNEDTWKTDTVTCVLPGGTTNKPYKTELPGCTNRDQAWREGISMAASNRDRRRNITFSADTPGLIPYFNSLARISHDVPQWGYCGQVLSLNRTTGVLRTTEPIPFIGTNPYVIAFRKRNGSEDGPYTIVKDITIVEGNEVYGCKINATPEQLAEIYVSDGIREERTYYQCGPTERHGMLVLIRSAVPNEDGQIDISAINYATSVYTAEEGGVVPPPTPESNLPTTPSAPVVDSVSVVYTFEVNVQNIIATPARGAIYYEFAARLVGSVAWANLGTNSEPTITSNLTAGEWEVRVRAVGKSVGPWATWTGVIEATTLPVARLDVFVATSKLFAVGLSWAFNAQSLSIARTIEIYVGVTNVLGDATKLVSLPYPANAYDHTNIAPTQTYYYWARVIDTAGRVGPWFNSGVGVPGQATQDAGLILDTLEGQITETQLSQALNEKIDSGGDATVKVEALESELAAMYTIKTQLTVDGKPYMAGIGVGVENDQGIITSQILLAAARVAVLDESSGTTKTPFIVQGGVVYMNAAMIQDASITNAKIGNMIAASVINPDTGQPIWYLDKTAEIFSGPATGFGGVYIKGANKKIEVRDDSNNLKIEFGKLN